MLDDRQTRLRHLEKSWSIKGAFRQRAFRRWATAHDDFRSGRDGVLYTSFNDMAAHNSLGYDYLSSRPGSVATNGQKKWRKAMAKRADN